MGSTVRAGPARKTRDAKPLLNALRALAPAKIRHGSINPADAIVRFGSLGDISRLLRHVRFAPDSDQKSGNPTCAF